MRSLVVESKLSKTCPLYIAHVADEKWFKNLFNIFKNNSMNNMNV